MLPTKPNSDLTVSQDDKPVLNSTHTVVANNSALQFANKAGKLIMKYPFWVLVISSLGIHTAFALVMSNPLKKEEPREVVVSTLPVVKLPPKSLTPRSQSNKSLFDNLFVKPDSKTSSPLNAFSNTFPNNLSNSPLSNLDLNSFDNLEDLSPVTDFSFSVPPLSSSTKEPAPRSFVRPPSLAPEMPQNQQRVNTSGKIENSNPVNTETANSNLKPEFRNGGLKDQTTSTSAPTKNSNDGTTPNKVSKNIQGNGLLNDSKTDPNDKNLVNIAFAYPIDEKLLALNEKGLIINTVIAPPDKLVSAINYEREQGVVWIPPKTENVSGKSGEAIFMWLVDPYGEVDTRYFKSSGNKEFDKIAKEAVKEYESQFQPIADPKSGKYRLVTAKYKFP